jgi:hypothetical protein
MLIQNNICSPYYFCYYRKIVDEKIYCDLFKNFLQFENGNFIRNGECIKRGYITVEFSTFFDNSGKYKGTLVTDLDIKGVKNEAKEIRV